MCDCKGLDQLQQVAHADSLTHEAICWGPHLAGSAPGSWGCNRACGPGMAGTRAGGVHDPRCSWSLPLLLVQSKPLLLKEPASVLAGMSCGVLLQVQGRQYVVWLRSGLDPLSKT